MKIIQIFLILSYVLASLNGVFICMKTKTALYIKLVVCAVVCSALSALNTTLLYNIFHIYPAGFRLSDIGIFSAFLFLLSSNYGTMDDIVDEGQKEYKKYRLLALLAPFGIVIILVLYCVFGVAYRADKISAIIIAFPGQAAAYYHLKHAILPDNGLNFIKPMRTFNILSIVFIYMCMLEIIFNNLDLIWCANAVSLILGILGIFIIPSCVAGTRKRNEY